MHENMRIPTDEAEVNFDLTKTGSKQFAVVALHRESNSQYVRGRPQDLSHLRSRIYVGA